ncbi:MAG: CRISPR-associated protein Cas5 [Myxococcales bacterium]|nr:CRISPR-associated protein Cas5 [Myxococcales bacterium]
MKTLWLRVRAPFAAFRWLQAGVYRATSPVIPPSAAWGMLLNFAHVETRAPGVETTLIRPDAPPLCLAVGRVALGESEYREPEVATIYQQLHGYPVGASGAELAKRTHGAKYWIAPVRRELLVGFDCMIGARCDDGELLARVGAGLRGELGEARYGLPFAGDNNLLLDRVDLLDAPVETRWYAALADDEAKPRGSCRLTVAIDRADSSRTSTLLCAPTEPTTTPPDAAWVWVPRAPG